MECSEAEGFHFLLVTYEHEEDEYLAQNDLLLLSKEEVHIIFLCYCLIFQGVVSLVFLILYFLV